VIRVHLGFQHFLNGVYHGQQAFVPSFSMTI
jgi:hypothetical protein